MGSFQETSFSSSVSLYQNVDEEMDSHGSDDSENFSTPPGSIVVATESGRIEPECPVGEETMEEDHADDEWKTIMPQVCGCMTSSSRGIQEIKTRAQEKKCTATCLRIW